MNAELPSSSASGTPATAGDLLKQGRLRQRLAISDCGKRTHIAPRYLEALEENRWEELPSESHRLGFLRSYARFLGVSADEVVAHYRRQILVTTPPVPDPKVKTPEPRARRDWFPGSWQTFCVLGVLLLALSWVLYHQALRLWPEEPSLPMVRERQPSTQARLITPNKPVVASHRIRIQADADSWVRVVADGRMLYEGILPARAEKDWTAKTGFQLKIGNAAAIRLFWNDQPVDVLSGSRGGIKDLKLPPEP